MANEPWRDKQLMYEWYVTRRMRLTDIQKLIKQSYGKEISPQALYNWAKRHDLLKYRGKGRNLSAGKANRQKMPKSPMAIKMAQMRKQQAMKRTGHRGR